jgi:hypothetical protein
MDVNDAVPLDDGDEDDRAAPQPSIALEGDEDEPETEPDKASTPAQQPQEADANAVFEAPAALEPDDGEAAAQPRAENNVMEEATEAAAQPRAENNVMEEATEAEAQAAAAEAAEQAGDAGGGNADGQQDEAEGAAPQRGRSASRRDSPPDDGSQLSVAEPALNASPRKDPLLLPTHSRHNSVDPEMLASLMQTDMAAPPSRTSLAETFEGDDGIKAVPLEELEELEGGEGLEPALGGISDASLGAPEALDAVERRTAVWPLYAAMQVREQLKMGSRGVFFFFFLPLQTSIDSTLTALSNLTRLPRRRWRGPRPVKRRRQC